MAGVFSAGQLGHVGRKFQLAQARRHAQVALHPQFGRNHCEQFVDRRRADGFEHGLAIGVGVGKIGHGKREGIGDDEVMNSRRTAPVASHSIIHHSIPSHSMLFFFTLLLVRRFVEQVGQAGVVGDLDLDEPAGPVGIVGQVFEIVGDGRVDLDDLAVHGAVEVADGLDRFDFAERLAGADLPAHRRASRCRPGRSGLPRRRP